MEEMHEGDMLSAKGSGLERRRDMTGQKRGQLKKTKKKWPFMRKICDA